MHPTETQVMCAASNQQSYSITVFCVIYAEDQINGRFPRNRMIPKQGGIIQLNECASQGIATMTPKAELFNPKVFPGWAHLSAVAERVSGN